MVDQEKPLRPSTADSDERKAVTTLDDPGERPGGSVSASDVARPRDRNAQSGAEGVVPGFTQTSVSGSAGGRALYGVAPDEEPKETEAIRKETPDDEEG